MIRFRCPTCGVVLEAPEGKGGAKINCPGCGQRLQIPTPRRNKTILGSLLPPAPTAPSPAGSSSAGAPILLQCPSCNGALQLSEDLVDRQARCPRCGAVATLRRRPNPAPVAQIQGNPSPSPLAGSLGIGRSGQAGYAAKVFALTKRLSAGGRAGLWRFASPSASLLALLLFCLPWVEVRCNSPRQEFSESIGSKPLVTQSGLQAIYGGGSLHPVLEAEKKKEEREAARLGRKDAKMAKDARSGDENEPMSWAPLFLPYPVLLLAVVIAGLTLKAPKLRLGLVGLLGAAALALLLLQTALGFPLENKVNYAITKGLVESTGRRDSGEALIASMILQVRYTGWYWMALLLTLAGPVLVGLEWLMHRVARPVSSG